MKKIVILLMLVTLAAFSACDDSVGTGIRISASLAELAEGDTFFHETKEDVTYEFTTFGETYAGDEGEGKLIVLVWTSDEDFIGEDDLGDPVETYAQTMPFATGVIKKDGGSTSVKLDAGTYFVLVMYDYKSNGNGYAGKNEFYSFHDGTYDKEATALVTVTDGEVNDLGAVTIGNVYKFQKNAAWYVIKE